MRNALKNVSLIEWGFAALLASGIAAAIVSGCGSRTPPQRAIGTPTGIGSPAGIGSPEP